MNKENCMIFNSESSESGFSSCEETTSDPYLYPKKRKAVVTIDYASEEEIEAESEVENSDDEWIEIESDGEGPP
jgi:hypothetical protein